MHRNWSSTPLLQRLQELAAQRSLDQLTIGPVLTHTTENILSHTDKLLKIPGAKLLFGGKPLLGHNIPDIYGAVEPTAVFVPLDQMLNEQYFELCTTEIFGPFQVVTEYDDASLPRVLEAFERMPHHLTAAIVSNDIQFVQHVLGNTVNGTIYSGRLARTTGKRTCSSATATHLSLLA